MGRAGQTGQTRRAPTLRLTGLKGSAANISVPDSTTHLRGGGGGSNGVQASMGQGWFGGKRGTNATLGGWSQCSARSACICLPVSIGTEAQPSILSL